MPNIAPILISLTAFGADHVKAKGQLHYAKLALDAGADGVEIRAELLSGDEKEIELIAQAIKNSICVYSCHHPLWLDNGYFNKQAFDQALIIARALGANTVKMSIGFGSKACEADFVYIRDKLLKYHIQLLIENDQTSSAGTIASLQDFFASANKSNFPIKMTFDMGNWHWQGECPLTAAKIFYSQVQYIHCKGVQRLNQKWGAVPLYDSIAPWRTVLSELPKQQMMAIEYPLIADNLLEHTKLHIYQLRQLRGM